MCKTNNSGENGISVTKYNTFRVELGGKYLGTYKTMDMAIEVRDNEYKWLNYHENHGIMKGNK